MQERALFYQGGSRELWGEKLENILIDLIDVSVYNKLKAKFERPEREDLIFNTNEDFWKHILNNGAYIDQYITLSNFFLTEWLPMSPGLFYTAKAKRNRIEAESYVVRGVRGERNFPFIRNRYDEDIDNMPVRNRVAVELNPRGKMSMVLGGIGALRLEPKKLFDNERVYLLGASSTGVCHEGVPVILASNLYHNIITQIKEDCGLRGKLIGRLCLLPTEDIPITYNREIPKYCLLVEEIKNPEKCYQDNILVSVAITYSTSLRNLREKEWSFVSFNPDKTDRQLIYSVEWLHDYAKRYSGVDNPIVLGDFDEYRQHFDKTEFSIKDIVNGKIDFVKLAQYEDFLNFKIINVMGDYFSDIKNSTIINRSTVENAFNKIKEEFDENTAAALAQIAKIVEESKNKEAGEVFNAFTEEIQKPEPKKSLLKSFWNGLTTLLPTVASIAGITEKVVKMIG